MANSALVCFSVLFAFVLVEIGIQIDICDIYVYLCVCNEYVHRMDGANGENTNYEQSQRNVCYSYSKSCCSRCAHIVWNGM